MSQKLMLCCAAFILMLILIISGIHPFDRGTWVMEVVPVVIVLPILFATYSRFPLTNLLYSLIFLHAIVLIVGGAYTYARVPLGFEIAQWWLIFRESLSSQLVMI